MQAYIVKLSDRDYPDGREIEVIAKNAACAILSVVQSLMPNSTNFSVCAWPRTTYSSIFNPQGAKHDESTNQAIKTTGKTRPRALPTKPQHA